MLSVEENKERTKGYSKRRKFQKPISYRAYINEKNQNCYEIRNKHEKVHPVDLLDEFYSVENSEADAAELDALGERKGFSLGKRSKPGKPRVDDQQKARRRGKYLDPQTGAYFNTF